MKWRRVLVLTFKPAAQSAWAEDLKRHVDFKGWQFISMIMRAPLIYLQLVMILPIMKTCSKSQEEAMLTNIGTITVQVTDQDKALEFYQTAP